MNNSAYLRRLESYLNREEREVFRELLPLLVRSITTIRNVLRRALPDEGLSRRLSYIAIKPTLEFALVEFNDTFRDVLAARLEALAIPMWEKAQEHFSGPNTSYTPRSAGYWLDTIEVFGGFTLRQYFQRRSPSQFMKEILRLVDRTVERGLLQGLPTEEIVRQIVPEVVNRTGKPQLTIRKGTVLSAIRNRVEGTISQAIWTLVTAQEAQVWAEEDVTQWIWSAILDAHVCPICADLDGRIEERREDFPYYPSFKAHPRCRCEVLPYGDT